MFMVCYTNCLLHARQTLLQRERERVFFLGSVRKAAEKWVGFDIAGLACVEVADFDPVAIGVKEEKLHDRLPWHPILCKAQAMCLQGAACFLDVWYREGDVVAPADVSLRETFKEPRVQERRGSQRLPASELRELRVCFDDVQRLVLRTRQP